MLYYHQAQSRQFLKRGTFSNRFPQILKGGGPPHNRYSKYFFIIRGYSYRYCQIWVIRLVIQTRAFETIPKPLQKSTISSIAACTKIQFGPMTDFWTFGTHPKPLQQSTISGIAAYAKMQRSLNRFGNRQFPVSLLLQRFNLTLHLSRNPTMRKLLCLIVA